jgi:hypothetical protein
MNFQSKEVSIMKRAKFYQGQVVRYTNAPSTTTFRVVKVTPPYNQVPAQYTITNLETGKVFTTVKESNLSS